MVWPFLKSDAIQIADRSGYLQILLTKAPTTSESDLVPWLKTVVMPG
jgi:hypothetical protein